MNANHSCSILVVEDCEDLRNLEVAFLENSGYKVATAANGLEALNALASMPTPCLVLLDLMMPIMNGYQFLNNVKTTQEYSHIPVLIISAISDLKETIGTIGHLNKPINLDLLKKIVSQYCH